ncbi:hypothetical protein ACJJIC_15420 [Microbulbifer sp. ANSA002]
MSVQRMRKWIAQQVQLIWNIRRCALGVVRGRLCKEGSDPLSPKV